MKNIQVSIIVPTFRRPEILKETLGVLTNLDFPKDAYEIIVVDDGSADSTSEVVKDFQKKLPRLTYHFQENSGVAKARNEGVRVAQGDVLIFNDDDILIEPDNIRKHLRHLSEFGNCLVCGHWEFTPELEESMKSTQFGRFRMAMENWYKRENKKDLIRGTCYQSQTISPQNASVRRKDFWHIGGFDEDFPYAGCEDHEFVLRSIKAGYKFIYDYDIRLLNNDRRIDIEQFGERNRRGAVTKVLIAHKFPDEEASHPMIIENGFVKLGEPLKRTAKKVVKKIMATSSVSTLLLGLTRFLEKNWKNSFLLTRLYTISCGIYIFRGIREGINRYGEPQKK